MKHFSIDSARIRECAVSGLEKWGVYINSEYLIDQVEIIAPFHNIIKEQCPTFDIGGTGMVLFDTEDLAREFYKIWNSRPFYASVLYAELISPDSGIIDCNT